MRKTALTIAMSLFAGIPAAQGQDTTLEPPLAAELVARYVEAIGGRDAILAQPGRRSRGTLGVPAMGLEGEIEIHVAPGRYRMRSALPEIGEVALGYDGEIGWMVHAMLGPSVLSGRMLGQVQEQARVTGALHEGDEIRSMEVRGRTDFEGRPVWELVIETVEGERYAEYFDEETGLLVGRVRTVASPIGEVVTTTILEDYRPADAILVPWTVRERAMGMEQVTRLTDVETITPTDGLFEPPAEIRVLLETQTRSSRGAGGGVEEEGMTPDRPSVGGRER